jgi:ABC-type antimicrobial peptide transport system permease subunit
MKNIVKFFELLFAVVLSAPLFSIGLVYNIVLCFKVKRFFIFLWKFLTEVYKLIFDVFEKLAVIIDRLGNVIDGNLFIKIFVRPNYQNITWFLMSEITISAAFGHSLKNCYLNERGLIFVRILDKVFGNNHCLKAYNFELLKRKFNSKTGIS